jgi:hypothetical protein
MTEDLPPDERYELMKLRILAEVQEDLTLWAKKRLWLLIAIIALVGSFGVSSIISSIVGESIEKRMESVNTQITATIKSTAEADYLARQATKSAEVETKRVNDIVTRLRQTLEKISKEATDTEDQLKKLSKAVESRSENVRSDAVLLATALTRRIENVEKLTQKLAKSTGGVALKEVESTVAALEEKAKQDRAAFVENSKYEVQIDYTDKNTALANTFQAALRKRGYRTSLWPNDQDTMRDWGVPLDFLEYRVTVFSPPGKEVIGQQLAERLTADTNIANIKPATDKRSNSGVVLGLVIPPTVRR